ncbi:deoxyuridine 5'-triphosphate nucleotidohydrolase [Luteitalea sp. TBR-22]|uniref:dUTP diphosphatase n=1 Tax=Luteitalea sp. TBR-22 TaxID=2802971 RepID=UPI001AF1D6BA|nr:dUTP diphosphatase [Luteitalea sp. TBR-22]BCS34286.1 deoxyuridine 5'-triphosphate nucleotidohydrolase [Luteitalea sp. TBR-22]
MGVRRLGDVPEPRYQTVGAAAMDLAAATDMTVGPGQLALVPTGLVFAVPPGHFLAIVARSSLPRRGLIVANGLGVLDSDYRGPADEARVLVLNYTQAPVAIARGDRIAQAFVLRVPRVEFVPLVHEADEGSRGGFGSTGEK